MQKKILIDASHSEETRIAILKQNVLEEYEFEVTSHAEQKGNIYLGKITKVEGSLQAAFVEYGGDKQGFLPFDEISLEYFNISKEEKQAILDKQQAYKENIKKKHQKQNQPKKQIIEDTSSELSNNEMINNEEDISSENSEEIFNQNVVDTDEETNDFSETINTDHETDDLTIDYNDLMKEVESENKSYGSRFGYKIQDVISTNQFVIVQVVKEKRGNKGASLTTYPSLPGRFCVLMPYTPFEGGISKKIVSPEDRKRLKNIINQISIPSNINVIIRTASLETTDDQIIQDYNYVYNLWNMIKTKAKHMKYPGIIVEEGILIKRVIRDLRSGNLDEIVIEGKSAYHTIKTFAKAVAPEILDKIRAFKSTDKSLFKAYNIDEEIRSIYSPVVFLPSGGYLVVNNTEALVAIDVNSGRSKGRINIEETALKTNLEAASKIASHIRLCDIGGLIVIDFIDMENPKNRTLVERKIKEECKSDKAKIQIGQISSFGLLEVSRQRIQPSLLERSFHVCPKCQGSGYMRPTPLNAINILRNIYNDFENNKLKFNAKNLLLSVPKEEAFYLLNNKRHHLINLENMLKVTIRIVCDDSLEIPFYKFKEETKKVEIPEVTAFVEQEIEYNLNKKKQPKSVETPKVAAHKIVNNNDANKKPIKQKAFKFLKKIVGF